MICRKLSILMPVITAMFFTACSSPKIVKIDNELKQTAALADAACAAGDWPQAAAQYTRALARARVMDRSAKIAEHAYALAACQANMGKWDQAARILDEADTEAQRAGTDTFNIRLLSAKVALWQANPAKAHALTKSLLHLASNSNTRKAQIHILLGQTACEANNIPDARAELQAAQTAMRHIKTPGILADWQALHAGVAMLEGKTAEAAAACDEAARLLQDAARYPEMAVMLERAGAAFEKNNDKTRALDRTFRAARSFAAAGNISGAKRAQARARALAEDPRDQLLIQRIDAMDSDLDDGSSNTTQPPQNVREPQNNKP